jgi:hypothetical protein
MGMDQEWTRNDTRKFHGISQFPNSGSFLVHSWDSWDFSGIHQELVGECKDLYTGPIVDLSHVPWTSL